MPACGPKRVPGPARAAAIAKKPVVTTRADR